MFSKLKMNGNNFFARFFPDRRNNGHNGGNHKNYAEWLSDYDCNFYIENYFQDLLYLERKRAERSGKEFLMVLVNISELFPGNEDRHYLRKIAHELSSCKRETDVAGWYKYDSIMGIILTEIEGINIDRIGHKIYKKLAAILDGELVKKIRITYHFFPEKNDKSRSVKQRLDLKLYPPKTKLKYCKKTSVILKRSIDLVFGLLGVILFSPFFLIIPILIKLSSDGPVFFRQTRVGQYGKDFTFLKFRTMHVNNDDSAHKNFVANLIKNNAGNGGSNIDNGSGGNGSKGEYKMKDDPRVTSIGRFLRKSSLDELPQFLNVLKGDMSLVGPRPPIPYEIDHYNIWHKRRIRRVKPGITGIWQVNGRSSTTFDEMVRMDIKYMREWNVLLDLKILFKTPFAVFIGKGAY